jgi:ribosome biogenesis GTPase / thiamine phosphate phosphatase
MNSSDFGWKTYTSKTTGDDIHPGFDDQVKPGRVITESAQLYRVHTDTGENWAMLTGSLLNTIAEKSEFPAVGDWVSVDTTSGHQHWIIREVLPRYSSLVRKAAGRTTEAQVLASNVDYVFVVNGLDGGRNFNLRGIERYVTACWESGAEPIVVLNKADLCDDVEAAVLQAESVAPGARVIAVSALTGSGFEEIARIAAPEKTIVLTGRSGVGKSSIINQLAGEQIMDTGGQRENDLRGRHTTTHRELVRLDSGALLIDTPGLREMQLWVDEESVQSAFPEIDQYADDCRFRDCSHTREPGCAVQEAVARGDIEQSRFESYFDMQKELKYLQSRQDDKARKQIQARGKEIAKFSRQLKKAKNRTP